MTALNELVDMIRETGAELNRARSVLLDHGPSFSLKMSVSSLEHRLKDLEERFEAASAAQGIDLCDYKMIAGQRDRYPLSALGAAMIEFQSFISVVYEALKSGKRKDSVKVRIETERATQLDFGYSYPGSLGFVFTMHPDEGRDAHSSLVDEAVAEFFKFVAIDEKDAVTDFVKRLGSAPVRIAQKWAHAHIAAGLEAQIEWTRDRQVVYRVTRDKLELEQLSLIIAAAGEPTMETIEVFGKLVAGNINSRSFQIDIDGKDPIRGRLHRSFNVSGSELVLGQMYTARLEKWTRSVIAKGGAQVTHMLLQLRR